jgi:hypothetical protein
MESPAARRAKKLGMPFGTAMGRLRKSIMYKLAGLAGLLSCFRCGRPIENESEFSIDHKKSWWLAEDPVAVFFDLTDIAFSHAFCNGSAAVRTNKIYATVKLRRATSRKRYWDKNKKRINAERREKKRLATGVQ